MRKYTKDIASLLMSFAVTSSLGSVAAYTDEDTPLADEVIDTDCYAETCTTTEAYNIGTEAPKPYTTIATTVPLIGTEVPKTATTVATTIPPLEGTYAPTPMTTDATTMPRLVGTEAPKTYTTVATTMPKIGTEIASDTTATDPIPPLSGAMMTLPPLTGDLAPADGDANGDGIFDESDITALNRFLLNASDQKDETDDSDPEKKKLSNWYGADLNMDNKLNAEDLTMMLREHRNQK